VIRVHRLQSRPLPSGVRPVQSRPLVAGALLAGLAAAAVCCERVLSIDGPIVIQGAVNACGIPVPAGDCERCVAAECCGAASACAADPVCLALESCLLRCAGDYGCRATCVESNPVDPQIDLPALDACVAANCNPACGMLCGQAGAYTSPDAAQGCQECVASHDCSAALACASNEGCEITAHCAYSCVTPDCRSACLAQSDAGLALASTVFNVGFACLSQCRLGHYWPCVGKISWPYPKSTNEVVTLTVTDPSHNGAPYAGLLIKACNPADPACADVYASGTTDSSGVAQLTLPPLAPFVYGFQGYFDLSSPSGDVFPYLYFLSFPISEANAQLALSIPLTKDFYSAMGLVNVSPDPERGHIAIVAYDCLLVYAPDVTVSAEGVDGGEFYSQTGLPNATASATDASGIVYFFNMMPGQYVLHVTPNDTGRVSSTVRVLVRAGALSVATALPTAF
jgi:hypothetical protein